MKKITTTISIKNNTDIKRTFEKVIHLLNSVVDSFSIGQTQKKGVKESGYVGQLRPKQLNKSEYTLEVMTDAGWKEAYIEVKIGATTHKGKVRFE